MNLKTFVKNKLKNFPTIYKLCRILWLFLKTIGLFIFTPFEGLFHRKHMPNNSVSLVINTECNIRCQNCYVIDKKDGEMSVEQIRSFINEALESGYRWDRLELRGGETTLHSNFFDILDIIKEYKEAVPECQVELLTNGFGRKVNDIIPKIPAWVEVYNQNKVPSDQNNVYLDFWNFTTAPIDFFQYRFFTDFSKGCRLITDCYGLCLSKYGYYPHPPCADVDKIFGFNIGIKKLSEVNEKSLRNQMKILCRYCGFFFEPPKIVHEQIWSETWERAYKKFKTQKPKLTLY
ncbi:radical SAM protein [Thermodesulfobacteriota bacterium]